MELSMDGPWDILWEIYKPGPQVSEYYNFGPCVI